MKLSAVVPTLNGRDRLAACLDSLAEHAPAAEVVVVNGPSVDGTTGMVRERGDVAALVETSERNVNVARNAGLREAAGDVVAFLGDSHRVEPGWLDAVHAEAGDGAAAVTGPVHRELAAGMTTEPEETGRVGRRAVTFFDGGNVAFDRATLAAIDGFDEYLLTGGAPDAAHRLAGTGRSVAWAPEMAVRRNVGTDGGTALRTDLPRPNATDAGLDRSRTYRSLAYRLSKNYGLRPGVARRVLGRALGDGSTSVRELLRGDASPTGEIAAVREVAANAAVGTRDGLLARLRDRSSRRNPNGASTREDRAVELYDWR